MVDPCHMIDIRSPGCWRTAVIFALRVGRTSDLTGLPKTLNGRGGRGFHGALTTAPPAPVAFKVALLRLLACPVRRENFLGPVRQSKLPLSFPKLF
jgi:hypothetical protein